MVCFMFPSKHLFVFFVLLFSCNVSCVLVNVTRQKLDVFAYPGIFKDCAGFCLKRNSYFKSSTKQGICICQCGGYYQTFVSANLKCVHDKEIRNAKGGYLDFQLYKDEQPGGDLKIIPFDSKVITILFNVKKLGDDKKCQLNDVEQLSHHKKANLEWNSVKHLLEKFHFFELDDDDIERIYTWLPLSYEGWMNLTLTWKVDPTTFVGRIMRLNVTCNSKKVKTGLMVFKVKGKFQVDDNSIPSTTLAFSASTTYHFIPTPSVTPTPSAVQSVDSPTFVYNTTIMTLSATMTSSPLSTMMSSSVVPMTTSLLKSITSSLQPMTSSLLLQSMTSSPLQSMTSSPLQSMTSSPLQSMTSSPLQPMTSSTHVPIMSPTPQSTSSASSLLMSSSVETTKTTYSSILSSVVIASSMTVFGPATSSKSTSNAAVTGAVAAGIIVLLVLVLLVVYVFRKRRLTTIRSKEKCPDIGNLNPNYSSFSNMRFIPALNNPLNDGVYENPEVADGDGNRCSGLLAIDSAAYDACIVVENPSNKREVRSTYDNIPEIPEENTYKALDPTTREPAGQYQSLVKPENEYSTVAEIFPDGPLPEPLYSEIGRIPSPVPRRNDARPSAPTPPPFNHKPVVEPIYNELEKSGEEVKPRDSGDPTPPPLAPRQNNASSIVESKCNGLGGKSEDAIPEAPPPPALPPKAPLSPQLPPVLATEPVQNELEVSGNLTEENEKPNELADGFEESSESDGDNRAEYSGLESDN